MNVHFSDMYRIVCINSAVAKVAKWRFFPVAKNFVLLQWRNIGMRWRNFATTDVVVGQIVTMRNMQKVAVFSICTCRKKKRHKYI